MSIEQEIIANKTARRDIDAIIQTIKGLPSSRERSLSITKLQECVMWLGMDLKRIRDANPEPSVPPKTSLECAQEAYARYGAAVGFKNFRGDPMPAFVDLPEPIINAWVAAITVPGDPIPHYPYPSSKDPSNTKIEATADGLKL